MDIQYKIFKLKNGDTIISEVNTTTDNSINLHRPMVFKIVTMLDNNMHPSDVVLFRNWAEFSTQEDIEISSDLIITSYSPNNIITTCYEMEKIKQDLPELYEAYKKHHPLPPMSAPPEMLPENNPINPFGQDNKAKPNGAQFHLELPLDVAKKLIDFLEEEGINLIGPQFSDDPDESFDDDEKDLEDDVSDELPNSQIFGNHPEDWSPDPNDYLK